MYPFTKRLASAALFLSLTSGGALLAQDDGDESDLDLVIPPPVVAIPVVPQVDGEFSRDDSRDWRGEIEADRERKGWNSTRRGLSEGPQQNWIREYQDRAYRGGDQRWDRFRDSQDRSDRIGPDRNRFTPMRPDVGVRNDAEAQAQAYAALYWMMKARAEREEAEDR
ncbi:MAG TPA: hypothetical protein VGN57_02910 [Pirellulaceae bacterium]|jgi:hypothetical protein|nr:hypothetical protein [Pirellulaceae bacterium]